MQMNIHRVKRTGGELIRDLLGYVAIALLVVAIIAALAFLGAKKGKPPEPFMLNWVGLGGVMAIVYVSAIHKNRRLWRNMQFWSGISLAMVFEIGVGTLALWNAPRLTVWFWGLLYPVNIVALDQFVSRWLVRT